MDYKFYKSRIVNLSEEYNCIHLSTSSSFFQYSFIKDKHFKEGIFNGEDTRFINNLLLINPYLGILKEAIYYYRKRIDSSSAVQNSIKNEEYYFSIFNMVDQYLIDKSIKLYNKILPFIQFYLAYNILFRISFQSYKYLEKDKLKLYYKHIEKILILIEDKYILEQKILSYKEKFFVLSKKYNYDLRKDIIIKNKSFYYSGYLLMNIQQYKGILVWRILEIKNNILHLEAKDNCILTAGKYFYFCESGNNIFYPKYFEYSGYDVITVYGIINKGSIVVFNIPLGNNMNQTLKFFLSYNEHVIEIFPQLGWFTPIPNFPQGYYNNGLYILKYIDNRINIFEYKENLRKSFENQYLEELLKKGKKNIIRIRTNYNLLLEKRNHKSQIWIINDKQELARDNGEYFFRFLKKKNPKGINFYFVIKKESLDYKRLKQIGNVLEYTSEDYLYKFLMADKIISSIWESWVDNPFGNDRNYIRDLFHFDFIFIQHGIIKDDLSKYINRLTKNFNLIVTSSNKEYNSILHKEYHYYKNNIILSGLPRYDNLNEFKINNKNEKIILIVPTWRFFIKGTFNAYNFNSIYYQSFKSTNFFNFYNNLINNSELIEIMKKYNYKGILCLHPYFSKQWKDFNENNIFSVQELCDYQTLIIKSSLLITDYSSIFFDFAYIKKPVIYTHFDYKEYRKYHYPKGYFNYMKQGFGPVCFDLNSSIYQIIYKIENNCNIENKYLKRINKFFKYSDSNNCQRLFDSLMNNSYKNDSKKYYPINRFSNIIIFLFFLMKYYSSNIRHFFKNFY